TTAVRNFGLMTGLRLEVENRWIKEDEVAFERVEVTRERIGQRAEKEKVVSYGKNQMAIDFEALAEKDNGAFKDLDEYVANQQASSQNEYTGLFKGKNLIFITAEAFTAEAIDRKRTPMLYRLANKGIQFLDYYQPTSAGTTGGEYANIFGMLPSYGGASMKMTANQLNWTTIASRLNDAGYYGKAYHNNDYTYYDRDKTHINLGYSDGFEGIGNGMEEYVAYSEWPESDLEMVQGTLEDYINKQPFNIYYMSVSGHSLYSEGQNAMAKKNWEYVEDLPYSENVKGYLGAQMELENALTYLVEELEERGIEDDTVIVIASDHFPYGLDQNSGELTYLSELYGYDITNNLERDHNRLIIWSGCLEEEKPIKVESPTSSIDILPTLCNLFGVEFDSRLLVGRDVFSDKEALVYTLGYEWKTDLGSFTSSKGFVPVSEEVEIPEGYVERIKTIVKNKISYSKAVLQKDYFRHVFGE
ncbi:MAG: LTA synthase family protein, partial [Erysipelotrichaceae bacterium]|nr:LTA synthase family protein [Erysipelotrichaceae bacterium]